VNRTRLVATFALSLAGVACSRTRPGTPANQPETASAARDTTAASPVATPSETVLTGKVAAVGLAMSPVTSLEIEGAKATTLIGPLEPELRRLGGATVWVAGSPVSGRPNATFTVTRYEILSIDGAKPLVGRLITRDGAPWLVTDRDTVKLVKAPAELTAKTGAKVWVIGRRSGAELMTQTYGVIRDP
jgi:hypothetical protein